MDRERTTSDERRLSDMNISEISGPRQQDGVTEMIHDNKLLYERGTSSKVNLEKEFSQHIRKMRIRKGRRNMTMIWLEGWTVK